MSNLTGTRSWLLLVLLLPVFASADLEPPYHPLFDGDQVHEIRLTFYDSDFWNIMEQNFSSETYLEAQFEWNDVSLDSIGVRFKGGSSYESNPTDKRSLKLDFNVFLEDQTLLGLRKINLNCNFNDPSFIREAAAYELCEEAGLPTLRTTFAAVYLNDVYYGLYTLVEQYDGQFIEDHFGDSEDGNLWKGDDHGSLEFMGWSPDSYYGDYELKTNEEENDWTGLMDLTYLLNNTPTEFLPDTLSEWVEVNSALALLAMDNLLVNLDSYAGRCVNYYLYRMDRDDRFVFGEWDMNESWGIFDFWGHSIYEQQTLDLYWVSESAGEYRPLAEILWDFEQYRDVYEGHIMRLMAGGADPATLVTRMEEMRDLIRDWVYMEVAPRRLFSPAQFEAAMDTDIPIGPGRFAPALATFVWARDSYLTGVLGSWDPMDDLVMNELMASNDTTIPDEYSEYDDWVEITNRGTENISLDGYYLTDDMSDPYKYAFPAMTISPGEYILVWADDTAEQGAMHAPFKLDKDGEDVYLMQGAVIIDQTTFPEIEADVSWGRWPDAFGDWYMLAEATPGQANTGGTGMEESDPVDPSVSPLSILASNPIAPGASLSIQGVLGETARLDVYDMAGRLVSTPFDGALSGTEQLVLDIPGNATGVYILRLVQGTDAATRMITVIR